MEFARIGEKRSCKHFIVLGMRKVLRWGQRGECPGGQKLEIVPEREWTWAQGQSGEWAAVWKGEIVPERDNTWTQGQNRTWTTFWKLKIVPGSWWETSQGQKRVRTSQKGEWNCHCINAKRLPKDKGEAESYASSRNKTAMWARFLLHFFLFEACDWIEM